MLGIIDLAPLLQSNQESLSRLGVLAFSERCHWRLFTRYPYPPRPFSSNPSSELHIRLMGIIFFPTEKNVWRCAIALGAGPRFVSSLLNYKMLRDGSPESKKLLIQITCFLDILRIVSAGGWTYISSSGKLFHFP